MTTIDDVAKKAGASKSSVSRVLNKNFEHMSEDMKQRILQVIKELNYTPNSLAQSLKTKKTQVIGIIISDISNPLWAEVLSGVQNECMKNGYSLMVSSSGEDPAVEAENVQILKNKQADGLIINTTGTNTDVLKALLDEKYPFVLLDRIPEDVLADAVIVDNILGATKALQFLIEQGHRRIAIFLYPTANKSPRIKRLEGYKQALLKHGLQVDESLIKICPQERGSGVAATLEVLSIKDRPTAIFSTHTFLNLEVITGVKKAGFKVPKDVSVIGYDDFPWVPLLDPPLSTVAQPAFEMGVNAAALLVNKIKSKRQKKSRIIQLEPKLIVRGSTCPPKRDQGGEVKI
jgi:DNA-binding LacI/PurR family transcriptional regulator